MMLKKNNTKGKQICLKLIFMDTSWQKEAILKIVRIEKERQTINQALESLQREEDKQQTLPGGVVARTPAGNVQCSSFFPLVKL